MQRLPLPSDPMWDSGEKRTALYHEFRKKHGINDAMVMALTGRAMASLFHWNTGKRHPINTGTLRSFMYDYLLSIKQEKTPKNGK